MTAPQPTRPRCGELTHADGTVTPLVFHPSADDPNVFVALRADTEEPARFQRTDRFRIDVIGPGQSVAFEMEEESAR